MPPDGRLAKSDSACDVRLCRTVVFDLVGLLLRPLGASASLRSFLALGGSHSVKKLDSNLGEAVEAVNER
jgi:hypothetical protein